jgi:hypothetical protein
VSRTVIFQPQTLLTAERLNASLDEVVDTGGAGALIGAIGTPLSEYGAVDITGAADMAPLINTAIVATIATNTTLLIGPGTYRLNSSLIARSRLRLWASQNARFTRFANATGTNGLWTVPDAAAAEVQATREKDIRIRGGIWGYDGAGDSQTWVGNYTGNVFSLYCDDMQIDDVWVDGFGPGRAFLIGGDRLFMHNIRTTRAPDAGGSGGIRYFGGTTFRCTDSYVESGDDCFQLVPGGNVGGLWFDTTIKDAIYANCQGWSYEARLMAVGLATPDRTDPAIALTLSASITAGQTAIAVVANALQLAVGDRIIAKATNEVMQVSATPTLDTSITVTRGFGGTTAAAITVGEDNSVLLADPGIITLSADITDVQTTINVTAGALAMQSGYVVAVRETGELMQLTATPVSDTSFTVTRGFGGTTAAAVSIATDTSVLQWNETQFRMTASIEDCAFIGIQGKGGGSAFTIENMDSSGTIQRLSYTNCVVDDFGNDDRPMAVIIAGRLGGVKNINFNQLIIRGSHRQAVEISGVVDGVTFRGGVWEKPRVPDRANVRLKGGRNIMFDGVTFAAPDDPLFDGMVIGAPDAVDNAGLLVEGTSHNITVKDCTITNVQNDQYGILSSYCDRAEIYRNTIRKADGVTTARGVGFATNAMNGFVDRCDFRECGHASPIGLGTTNNSAGSNLGVPGIDVVTQSAAGGTLTWTPGKRLIRVNGAGTVTALSGTPESCVVLTIRSVVVGCIINNTSNVRLTPAANVTLDVDESVELTYDALNGYWFQTGGGQR